MIRAFLKLNKNLKLNLLDKTELLSTQSFHFKRNNSSDSNQQQQKPKVEEKMDQFKSNPYFAKYEAKLKAVYK